MIKTMTMDPSHVLRDESVRPRGDAYLSLEGVRCRTVAPRWTVQGSSVSAAGGRLVPMSGPTSIKTSDFVVVYNPGFRHWSPPV